MNMKKQVFPNFPLGKKTITIILNIIFLILLSSFVFSITTDDPDLIAFWKLDDAGSVFTDSKTIGTPYSLDYNGALQQQTPLANYSTYSVGFDGRNDALNNSNDLDAPFLSMINYTIGLWVIDMADDETLMHYTSSLGSNIGFWFEYNDNLLRFQVYNVGATDCQWTNEKYSGMVTARFDTSSDTLDILMNGSVVKTCTSFPDIDWGSGEACLLIGTRDLTDGCNGAEQDNYASTRFDDIFIFNRTLTESEIADIYQNGIVSGGDSTPPTISALNCTSCNIPNGDTTSPYETEDTTPTFKFDTDENAWCRIDDDNLGYGAMGSSRNCSSGEGGESEHICTLDVSDELKLAPTDYVYINCKDSLGNNETIGYEMQITQIQYNASQAMEKGIVISIPSATIYSDQRIYIKTASNNGALATFDKVALYGVQRWAFNYIAPNESSIGTFYNLSPIFYFLELDNLSTFNIISQVSDFINGTKT